MTNSTTGKRLLIAGGDLRQITTAARLAEDCDVTVIGFDRFGVLPEGVSACEHISGLPLDLDALILPMPVTQDGVFLHTPFGSSAIRLSSLLPLVRAGGMVFGGRLTVQERTLIGNAGLRAFDYAAAETFALRNAIPTAEGAIQIAMQELPVVLHRLPVLILGAGRVSRALQQRLKALGAEVTVAARRCTDLARRKGAVGKPAGSAVSRFPSAPFRGAYWGCCCYGAGCARLTVWFSLYCSAVRSNVTGIYYCAVSRTICSSVSRFCRISFASAIWHLVRTRLCSG
ncbi:MAG: hypothetical protein MJ065_02365 [Oscillospiraceae bacterium]|nr:hypothetical protein [Oscillospiraceae bacterium]